MSSTPGTLSHLTRLFLTLLGYIPQLAVDKVFIPLRGMSLKLTVSPTETSMALCTVSTQKNSTESSGMLFNP